MVPRGCATKERVRGTRRATKPVPERLMTVAGDRKASEFMVTVPVFDPTAAGVNVMLMVQVALGASVAVGEIGQVLVAAASLDATMLVICMGAWPKLVTMTVCGVLAVPTARGSKLRKLVESLI